MNLTKLITGISNFVLLITPDTIRISLQPPCTNSPLARAAYVRTDGALLAAEAEVDGELLAKVRTFLAQHRDTFEAYRTGKINDSELHNRLRPLNKSDALIGRSNKPD